MRLHSVQEVDAPMDFVFDFLCDLDTHFEKAKGYGARVTRTSSGPVGVGATWNLIAPLRGKDREFDITLSKQNRATELVFDILSKNLEIVVNVDISAAGVNSSQAKVVAKFKPRSMTARLMIQSAKLAQKTISRRFDLRVQDLMERIEDAYGEAA